jgi:hypothetical protein
MTVKNTLAYYNSELITTIKLITDVIHNKLEFLSLAGLFTQPNVCELGQEPTLEWRTSSLL